MFQLINLVTEASDVTREQLAKLYCQIWREPPWNEDNWTIEQVLADLRQELQLLGALGYTANDPHVVGFTWGYQVNKERLQTISGSTMLNYMFAYNQKTFYVDELGVDNCCRQRGVGSILTSQLLNEVWWQEYQQVVLRTDDQAEAAIKLYQRLGFVNQPFHDAAYATRRYWVLKKQE